MLILKKNRKRRYELKKERRIIMKKFNRSLAFSMAVCLGASTVLTGCGTSVEDNTGEEVEITVSNELKAGENGEVYVFNWGEYIGDGVIEAFEKETGIKVNYMEFTENEDMYPLLASGANNYDVVCPSDYMVDKLIKENLIQPIDKSKITNYGNIDPEYLKSAELFDPGNQYCVPYCWGTVGILYNTSMVDEEITSWNALFDEKYSGQILMMNSLRDAYMIALTLLGYDLNTSNEAELDEATDLLKKQKPLIQAYVVDEVRDKMIGGEAAIGVIYSGEAIYTARENPDLKYVVPDEGSNVWIDGWVIPTNSKNTENAYKWIDFMCRADVALANFNYITYSTPNKAARELITDEDIKNSTVAFPGEDILSRCKAYNYLTPEVEEMYMEKWNSVKSN